MELAKPELKENQELLKIQTSSANFLDNRPFGKASFFARFMDEVLLKATKDTTRFQLTGAL